MAGTRGVRLGTVCRGSRTSLRVRVRPRRAQRTGERALQTSRTGGVGGGGFPGKSKAWDGLERESKGWKGL
jgi:hypothetical protein